MFIGTGIRLQPVSRKGRGMPFAVTSADVIAWFDVQAAKTVSGGLVTVLPDLSSHGHNASGTGLSLVSFRGGRQAVSCQAGGQRLRAAFAAPTTQPTTVYLLGQWATDGTNAIAIDSYSSGTARHVFWQNGSPRKVSMFAGSVANSTLNAPFGEPFIARVSYNGASSSIRIETIGDAVFEQTGLSAGTQGLDGISLCTDNTGASFWNGSISLGVWVDGTPDASDNARILQYLRQVGQMPYLNLVAAGNSLTVGDGSTNPSTDRWPVVMRGLTQPVQTLTLSAHGGWTTPQLTDVIDTEVMPALSTSATNLLMIYEARNDMYYGATPAEAWQHIVEYKASAIAQGWTGFIATCTIGPGLEIGHLTNAKVDEFNALVRANWQSAGFAFISDFGDDPALDPPAADGIHYNTAQYAIIGDYWADAARAFFGTS